MAPSSTAPQRGKAILGICHARLARPPPLKNADSPDEMPLQMGGTQRTPHARCGPARALTLAAYHHPRPAQQRARAESSAGRCWRRRRWPSAAPPRACSSNGPPPCVATPGCPGVRRALIVSGRRQAHLTHIHFMLIQAVMRSQHATAVRYGQWAAYLADSVQGMGPHHDPDGSACKNYSHAVATGHGQVYSRALTSSFSAA